MTREEQFEQAKKWFIKELQKESFESGAVYYETLITENNEKLIEYSFSFKKPFNDESN